MAKRRIIAVYLPLLSYVVLCKDLGSICPYLFGEATSDQRDYDNICVLRSADGGKHWTSTLGIPRPAV
jgi:hypothetical protein